MPQAFLNNGDIKDDFLIAYADTVRRKDTATAQALFDQAFKEANRISKRFADVQRVVHKSDDHFSFVRAKGKHKIGEFIEMYRDTSNKLSNSAYGRWALNLMHQAGDGIIPSRQQYGAIEAEHFNREKERQRQLNC